jgi:hypothetical protein
MHSYPLLAAAPSAVVGIFALWALVALAEVPVAADESDRSQVQSEGPVTDPAKGVQVFTITSPYQRGANKLEVLLPDTLEPGRAYRVLYVLPVGGDFGVPGGYGDQLTEVRKSNAHNRYGLICASMAFDTTPWYGNHATDPNIRHEDYILRVIVPLIDARFPVSHQAKDRLLLGFSKSGYGAVNLLLRHPDVFGAACSWDAPLAFIEANFGNVGTSVNFGTRERMADYLPMKLAEAPAATFRAGGPRLTILGRKIWWNHQAIFHDLLTRLEVPHRYDDSLVFEHRWDSGWLPKAIEIFLGKPAGVQPGHK